MLPYGGKLMGRRMSGMRLVLNARQVNHSLRYGRVVGGGEAVFNGEADYAALINEEACRPTPSKPCGARGHDVALDAGRAAASGRFYSRPGPVLKNITVPLAAGLSRFD